MAKANNTKQAPLVTLKADQWLGTKYDPTTGTGGGAAIQSALRAKFGNGPDAPAQAQIVLDKMVAQGAIAIPAGMVLRAVGVRRFGGALSAVVTDPANIKTATAKPKLDLSKFGL